MPLSFETRNYLLRPLSQYDVSERWGAWLADPELSSLLNTEARFVSSAELSAYVDRFDGDKRVLLGLFHKPTGAHAGLFTSTVSDSGRQVLWNMFIGERAYRNAAGLLEIRGLRADVGRHFFIERGFEAAYASVAGSNHKMIAYLRTAYWEHVRSARVPERGCASDREIEVHVFRLSRQRYLDRERRFSLA